MKTPMKQSQSSLFTTLQSTVLLLAIAFSLSSCTQKDDIEPNSTDTDTLGEEADAPAFTLKSLAGLDVSLSDFEDKVVVLFFFGNNCPSCKSVAPTVESSLVTAFASNTNYAVLGLDQWNGNAASVDAFRTSTGVSFPLLLNASGVASNYKTTFDRIIVLNKSHKIVFSGKQAATSDVVAAKAKVTALLSK